MMKSPVNAFFFTSLFILISVLIRKIRGDERHLKGDYDERQLRVRGSAYRISFFICLLEFALLLYLEDMTLSLPLTDAGLYAIMFLLPIGVFSVICIRKDAYIGIRNNLRGFIRLSVFVIVADAECTYFRARHIWVNGKLTGNILTPGTGILFLVILISLLIRRRELLSEEADEES